MDFEKDLHGRPIKDLKDQLKKNAREILEIGFENFQEGDMARMYLNHPQIQKPIVLPPQHLEEVIMEAVENVLPAKRRKP